MKNIPKRKRAMTEMVSCRIDKLDADTLRAYDINMSEVMREALIETVKRIHSLGGTSEKSK